MRVQCTQESGGTAGLCGSWVSVHPNRRLKKEAKKIKHKERRIEEGLQKRQTQASGEADSNVHDKKKGSQATTDKEWD